jgi:hypothetical protein
METKTYTTVDRTGWPSGEWDNEPDKVQWPDEATGLPCLAVRNPGLGNWCGYVGVPPGHPLYGKPYQDVDSDLQVHGGVTFSDACNPKSTEATGICHVAEPGEPDHVWWFGFDCAHAWDISPGLVKARSDSGIGELFDQKIGPDEIYRTLTFVQEQCRKLAAQLKERA